jgi:hypothetical protein
MYARRGALHAENTGSGAFRLGTDRVEAVEAHSRRIPKGKDALFSAAGSHSIAAILTWHHTEKKRMKSGNPVEITTE